MNLSDIFGWNTNKVTSNELPVIFPMPIIRDDFVDTDVISIYSKILTDVLERTHGLSEDQFLLMWDNCVKSSSSDGLVTLLAKAMTDKADLYIVYDKSVQVIRVATFEERAKIEADYKRTASSPTGVYISFKNYRRSDMVKLYSALEYSTVACLNVSMNLASAAQLKFSDLRASVSLIDSSDAKKQAETISNALINGRPVMLDAKDEIATLTPELAAVEKSIAFIANKLGFYLGFPASYITSEQTGGIGSTGEGDQRATERGFKNYFFSIVKPVLEAVFGVTITYKSQDARNITGALEVLKTFQLTDEEFISSENKQKIVNQVFDLPEDAEGDGPAEPAPIPGAAPVPPAADPATL